MRKGDFQEGHELPKSAEQIRKITGKEEQKWEQPLQRHEEPLRERDIGGIKISKDIYESELRARLDLQEQNKEVYERRA